MDEWKSLNTLICEYIEAQKRLEQAIARNRAQMLTEPNRRRRLRLDREHQILLTMRADLAYEIGLMRRYVDGVQAAQAVPQTGVCELDA